MSGDIVRNLQDVRERMKAAGIRSSTPGKPVVLVAVSKNAGMDAVRTLIQAGHRDFGENRTREFGLKHEAFGEEARFHFIGHLQTNKAREVVGKAALIHSVDSLRLLEEIQKLAKGMGKVQNVLLQVDISGEDSKFGADKKEILEMIKHNESNGNVRIKGLMTMAPHTENPGDVRWVFRELGHFYVDIARKSFYNTCMEYASMGMSNDFEVAIEEGSSMVRVGSSIFGHHS
ncbi:MAG: YggS family pyridoxal phosphate-dependent enzyme [Clostridia bacterium]